MEHVKSILIGIISSVLIVAGVVAWLGIGSGLIDPHRLFDSQPPARVLSVK